MNIKCYLAYSKNKSDLFNSTSGGFFYEFAQIVITKYKGIVYGAVVENGDVFHKRIDNAISLHQLQKSKYVASKTRNAFVNCLNDLKKGNYVLFSGTPCQIKSLHSYLDINNVNKEKLISIDLVCHGVPQSKYWDIYKRLTKFSFSKKISYLPLLKLSRK